jgi:two-component system LytT family response regulator
VFDEVVLSFTFENRNICAMIKAIIIDDEARARSVLRSLIDQFCPEVEIVAECVDVPDAVVKINKFKPDVVFCDIEMPNYSGLELVSFFEEVNFEIIFATGYSEYAIQAFEVSAVEYLLKPIRIEKLEIAVEKLKLKLEQNNMATRIEVLKENLSENVIQKIALPVIDGLVFVNLLDIELLEADGSYTKVWFANGENLLISKRMKFFETLLSKHTQFYRAHRTYLVNINAIKKYSRKESYIYMDNAQVVSISRDKKTHFENYISNVKL